MEGLRRFVDSFIMLLSRGIRGDSTPVVERLNICGRYRFLVEIDGITRAAFREVEGLGVTVDVVEYREGSDVAMAPRLEPGLAHYGPLVLRYGVISTSGGGNRELWNWVKQTIEGNTQRRNIAVIVLDRRGNEVVRYNLSNAWPSSWRLDKLDGRSSCALFEELTLQYEALDLGD
jgi:phage tail-like protein